MLICLLVFLDRDLDSVTSRYPVSVPKYSKSSSSTTSATNVTNDSKSHSSHNKESDHRIAQSDEPHCSFADVTCGSKQSEGVQSSVGGRELYRKSYTLTAGAVTTVPKSADSQQVKVKVSSVQSVESKDATKTVTASSAGKSESYAQVEPYSVRYKEEQKAVHNQQQERNKYHSSSEVYGSGSVGTCSVVLPSQLVTRSQHYLKMGNESSLPMELCSTFDAEEIKRLGKRFKKLDLDNSGSLSVDEFMSLPELQQNPLVQRVIDILDVDGNGEIDFKEFIEGISQFSVKGLYFYKVDCIFSIQGFSPVLI